MFAELERINERPGPFEFYTAEELWTDEHTAEQMLACHLNPDVDLSSRNHTFIDRSASWIATHFELGPGKAVADFGCGPGLYASRLARSGAAVTGIDFSKNSIEYAREKAAEEGSEIEYVNQNYLDFESPLRFDLIVMIMCDFCALSPGQRRQMLVKFHDLLSPGGAVLLDVYSLSAFAAREEGASYALNQLNGFWSAEKYYGFLNTFKYETEKVVLDKYTLIEADRSRVVYNWLQYFAQDRIRGEFEEAGLSVEACFGDVAGSDFDPEGTEYAVVAGKVK
ncbi:MAG: SAM-dependent methyltransferase [Planctomycetota bacterium]|jgi:cyclopropane fatty-acyl-phospholipid synthase-like methyltransferase